MFAIREVQERSNSPTLFSHKQYDSSVIAGEPMTDPNQSLGRSLGNDYLQSMMPCAQVLRQSIVMTGVPKIQRACACGNSGEEELIGIQTKLPISQPGDVYEQEAERMAEHVMRMPEPYSVDMNGGNSPALKTRNLNNTDMPMFQRQAAMPEEPYREMPEPYGLTEAAIAAAEEEHLAQAKEIPGQAPKSGPSVENAIHALNMNGQMLPNNVQQFMETRFGVDFSRVRIHTETRAANAAHTLHARAFTVGRNIYFGQGEYQPDSDAGRRLLAHELTHVVQQRQAGDSGASRLQRMSQTPDLNTFFVQRSLADGFNNYTGSCVCGEALGNNCAHYLSDSLIQSGYAADLDGGVGALYRRRNGFVVCKSGRPVRAAELRGWFAGQATDTVHGEPTAGNRYWAVYQERASDGQGHILIHSHTGAAYTFRGTGDYPTWHTQDHYNF